MTEIIAIFILTPTITGGAVLAVAAVIRHAAKNFTWGG